MWWDVFATFTHLRGLLFPDTALCLQMACSSRNTEYNQQAIHEVQHVKAMDKITRTPVESSSTAAQIKSLRNNDIEWTNLNKNEHSCCTDKVLYVHHHTCSCIMHMCNLKYKCVHYKQNKWVKSTNLTKNPSEDWKGSLCLPLVVGTGHDAINLIQQHFFGSISTVKRSIDCLFSYSISLHSIWPSSHSP